MWAAGQCQKHGGEDKPFTLSAAYLYIVQKDLAQAPF